MRRNECSKRQLDPNELTEKVITFCSASGDTSITTDLRTAQSAVRYGQAFVLSNEAIGEFD